MSGLQKVLTKHNNAEDDLICVSKNELISHVEDLEKVLWTIYQDGDFEPTDFLRRLKDGCCMKAINIDWLENCPVCDHSTAVVYTIGSKNYLYDGDKVECGNCGMNGLIESVDCETV